MSFFPNLYGLGADSVENYKVSIQSFRFYSPVDDVVQCVLANSTFVNANARENPDLFKTLKGGGSNFGIGSLSVVVGIALTVY
jgi:hypothetical protein